MKSDSVWMSKYMLAKAYYEYHGNLEVPCSFKTKNGYEYDEDGIGLGIFIKGLRTAYGKGSLSPNKIELLKQVGMRFNSKDMEQEWMKIYTLAKVYYEENRNLKVPIGYKAKDGINLGYWIKNQKKAYRENRLSQEKIEMLRAIGLCFETRCVKNNWKEKYQLAKNYYEHYGDLEIYTLFRTSNGYDYDENGIRLGYWINTQRNAYKTNRLSKERYELLKAIGMRFEYNVDLNWEKMYELACLYYKNYNNLEVPFDFKTKDGINYDENGLNLGLWIVQQRYRHKKVGLPEKRKILLDKISMNFEGKLYDIGGMEFYKLAKSYYEHYGDLEIPNLFKTKDGVTYDADGVALGCWITNQRRFYIENRLPQERYELLCAIGMRFESNKHELTWEKKYQLAKNYYEHYGNLNMPLNFRTKDGVTYDENGIKLCAWISRQKNQYLNESLSEERIKLLENIGMNFSLRNYFEDWLEIYELARKYYEHYGHLEVLRNFSTSNGYEYDSNGVNLGTWISTQRIQYSKDILSKEKIDMLNLIGMVWSVRKKNILIKLWCDENNVDYNKNKKILEHISYQELVSKTLFLSSVNGSLITIDGKLHEIFSMSSINIQAVYGISLEELIKKYYITNDLVRVRRG